ncbi:hypothetical protein V2G26_014163 [Clonostachys chloroleuca]
MAVERPTMLGRSADAASVFRQRRPASVRSNLNWGGATLEASVTGIGGFGTEPVEELQPARKVFAANCLIGWKWSPISPTTRPLGGSLLPSRLRLRRT